MVNRTLKFDHIKRLRSLSSDYIKQLSLYKTVHRMIMMQFSIIIGILISYSFKTKIFAIISFCISVCYSFQFLHNHLKNGQDFNTKFLFFLKFTLFWQLTREWLNLKMALVQFQLISILIMFPYYWERKKPTNASQLHVTYIL